MLRKDIHIRPIEPCPGAREHLHRRREERDQLPIPAAHLPARVPERTEDGVEVAPSSLLQRGHEGVALAFLGRGPDDDELGRESLVDGRVVPDGIAEVENDGFSGVRHGGIMYVQYLL